MAKESSGKKALKAGIGYTVGNVLLKGITFLSIPLFSRLLSVADYGVYSIYASYVSVLAMVVGFSLHASVKNAVYDHKDSLNEYCSSVSLITLFNMVILVLVCILFAAPLSNLLGVDKHLLALIALESGAIAMTHFYNAYLAVDYRYKEYLYMSLIYAAGGVVLSVVLILTAYSDKGYMGRAMGAAVAAGVTAVYILVRLFHAARPKINLEYWRYGLKISLPIVPHGLSQLVLSQFDRIMIKKSIGDTQAGLYSFAGNVGVIYQVVAGSLDTAWAPWFFEKMERREYDQIRTVGNWFMSVLGLGAVSLMLVSPELITIMGGAKYDASRQVAIPIILAMFFAAAYNLPVSVEYYYKKTKIIAAGSMMAAVLNIILNSIFIPLYGYVAAAYTTVTCYVLYYCIHVLLARKIHGSVIYSMSWHILCPVGVTAFSFLCLGLLGLPVLRWGMVVVILGAAGMIGYRKLSDLKGLMKN